MKSYFILLLFTIFNCFGQDISEINKVLEISDTLEYQHEIRIYKNYSIGSKIVIFRMFKEKNDWSANISYYDTNLKQITKINGIVFPKENIGKLKPVDPNLIWLNVLITNVEFLPSMESIEYKLNTPYIDLDKGENQINRKKVLVTDGIGYQVYIKNGKIKNTFSFYNPETYLKYYPAVDELIAYNELLSIINKEFEL